MVIYDQTQHYSYPFYITTPTEMCTHHWRGVHDKKNGSLRNKNCVWHKGTYLQTTKRFRDIKNRCVVAKAEGGGKDWEFGISRWKLLDIGWINNKDLLHSTGNYIQYPVINHNGKEHWKECIHVYYWVTLLYSRDWHKIVCQLYFSKNKIRTIDLTNNLGKGIITEI